MNPSKPSTTPAAKTSSETGFVIIERLLQERRQRGRSVTLDRWIADAKAKIAQYRVANTSPKAQQEVVAVERAIESAAELMETLSAANRATGPSGAR